MIHLQIITHVTNFFSINLDSIGRSAPSRMTNTDSDQFELKIRNN